MDVSDINILQTIQQKRSAAIYLRVSSEMQVDGFSIEAQKIACLKYAIEQEYEVTNSHIYEAYTVSGTQQLFEKFERDQKADQNLLEKLAQKLPKESAVGNT